MIVILTPEAEEDFERIGNFIAMGNPPRAQNFIGEIYARCLTLADMPYRNYVVFYRVMEQEIYILHILNGAQDHEPILFPEDDEA